MGAIELLLPTGHPAKVWCCSECKRLVTRQYMAVGHGSGDSMVYYTEEERDELARKTAEECCQEAKCGRCDVGLGRKNKEGGWMICQACIDKSEEEKRRAVFEKAGKVTVLDGNMLYDEFAGRWYRELEDVYECCEWEEVPLPAYVWLSQPVRFSADVSGYLIDQIYDQMGENASDQISIADWAELDDMVDRWLQPRLGDAYDVDYKRCLVLAEQDKHG